MTDIKSQNDLNQPKTHSTEVLLEVISKLETTTKQLEIAVEVLESFAIDEFYDKNVAHKSANALNKIKELEK